MARKMALVLDALYRAPDPRSGTYSLGSHGKKTRFEVGRTGDCRTPSLGKHVI